MAARLALRRLEISFSQGVQWKALISRYIGTIPVSGEAWCVAEHSMSGMPPSWIHVRSAIMAKVGAAASDSQLAALAFGPPRTGLAAAFPHSGLSAVRHLDPFGVGRGVGDVALVPVPPLVRPALRIALRRVFPLLLTPERGHVEIAPDGAHRLVAAAVDEVGAKHALAVADERVVAVPFLPPDVGVEAVGDGDPGDFFP